MGAGAKKGGASGNRKQLREGAGEGSPEGFPTALTGPRRNMFVSVSLSLHILTFPVQSEKKKNSRKTVLVQLSFFGPPKSAGNFTILTLIK